MLSTGEYWRGQRVLSARAHTPSLRPWQEVCFVVFRGGSVASYIISFQSEKCQHMLLFLFLFLLLWGSVSFQGSL